MSRPNSPRRTTILVVRVVAALLLGYLGALLAFGSYVAMMWQLRPSAGGSGTALGAAGFGLLAGALVAAAMAAWWFLVPPARWWGIPINTLFVAGTFAAFLSNV
ncbi:hypothetical protein [Jidongwangia harbinensis]|uniref:hypothetical protein n=1 Tax=Jidongwangia harbinensis TaxID=2878561 RepID=UPI001CD9CF54|nr:hypothetical protein [Jidongwangia harbinensis]MCA2215542.1 hypothetical protein [Jidongwangia harbinensis]